MKLGAITERTAEILIESAELVNETFKELLFVEVGIKHARTSRLMYDKIKEFKKPFKYYGIDIAARPEREWNKRMKFDNAFFYKENSWDAAKHFKDKSVHWCFIDADHSYEAVMKDIQAWLPKIAEGGFVLFHDTDVRHNMWYAHKAGQTYGILCAIRDNFSLFKKYNFKPYMEEQVGFTQKIRSGVTTFKRKK